jgi:hypothetical protein
VVQSFKAGAGILKEHFGVNLRYSITAKEPI